MSEYSEEARKLSLIEGQLTVALDLACQQFPGLNDHPDLEELVAEIMGLRDAISEARVAAYGLAERLRREEVPSE